MAPRIRYSIESKRVTVSSIRKSHVTGLRYISNAPSEDSRCGPRVDRRRDRWAFPMRHLGVDVWDIAQTRCLLEVEVDG